MDQEILALAMVLGNVSESDRERLELLCGNARRELEGLRARAGEERLRLGKVYGALGVTAGAFLVILLL